MLRTILYNLIKNIHSINKFKITVIGEQEETLSRGIKLFSWAMSLAQYSVVGNVTLILPVEGIGFELTRVIIIFDVELTVVGAKVTLKLANVPFSKVTAAVDPEESNAVTSLPIYPMKGEVVVAGDGFMTEPTWSWTVPIKVSAVNEFWNMTLLLTVSTRHITEEDNAPSMTIKSHDYDPPSVY